MHSRAKPAQVSGAQSAIELEGIYITTPIVFRTRSEIQGEQFAGVCPLHVHVAIELANDAGIALSKVESWYGCLDDSLGLSRAQNDLSLDRAELGAKRAADVLYPDEFLLRDKGRNLGLRWNDLSNHLILDVFAIWSLLSIVVEANSGAHGIAIPGTREAALPWGEDLLWLSVKCRRSITRRFRFGHLRPSGG